VTIVYPTTFSDIRAWSRSNGVDANEGRIRFVQYTILHGIGSSRTLSELLVFKGGNALDFVWQPNRSTRDLDFSADMGIIGDDSDPTKIADLLRSSLEAGLRVASEQRGVVFAIHSVTKQPPGPERTFVTYELRVGYALPDQQPLIARMVQGLRSSQVIPIEVSLNEPICADRSTDIQASHWLRVSTIEDIVAEKLRALLQQPIRNRGRRQDLLDIAVLLHE
jgi:predicted nucleotidyltransferase component of viral defense system